MFLLFSPPPAGAAGAVLSADYITEYSTDRIEVHVGAIKEGQRVVLVDDLIATGGTLREYPPCLCRCAMLCCRPCTSPARSAGSRRPFHHVSSHSRVPTLPCLRPCTAAPAPCPSLLPAVAGVELVKLAGGEVVEAACVIELPELKGREKLGGLPLHVLVEKEGL